MRLVQNLQRHAPASVRTLRALYNRSGCQRVLRLPKRVYVHCQQMNNNGIYAINIHSNCGLFAAMQIYMYILVHCDSKNLLPYVTFTGKSYASERHQKNWLMNYFYYKLLPSERQLQLFKNNEIAISMIRGADDFSLRDKYAKTITLESAHALCQKYIGIRGEILQEVDRFVSEQFAGRTVLGVHYRGTDKQGEAEHVPWDRAAQKIFHLLALIPAIDRIFVATDEREFVEFLIRTRLHPTIIYLNKKAFGQGKIPPHWHEQCDKYQMGREALIDCLLLSRCNYCVKTASYLSGWSKIFNPDLPVVMLNRPYRHAWWFPDAEIWQRQFVRL